MPRIYLSPPDVDNLERELLLEAFDSNWLAPLGPHVDAFEAEMAARLGVAHAVAMSSGTAALHVALLVAGVRPDDEVIVPTLTFVATANAVSYIGARPVFVDADPQTWNIDPQLLADEMETHARTGRLPAAVVTVDLYGQCADYEQIVAICGRYEVPLVEDAAEALGASYQGRPAGTFGVAGVLSFNGNKIITTSGGGMLVTDSAAFADRARHLATQAREPTLHYEHELLGFNYRLSNLLAAVGRGQLASLDAKVERRRAIHARYRTLLGELAGLGFLMEASYGRSTHWLTVITVDQDRFGVDRDAVIAALAVEDIEARPAWKPMHLQPLYREHDRRGGDIAAAIFERGVCLPSGSSLCDHDLDTIAAVITDCRMG